MNQPRRSVTLTLVVIVGLALVVVGALVAIAGAPGAFEFSAGDNTIKTDSVGLAIMAVGALLVLVPVLRSGASVNVFANAGQPSGMDRLVGWLGARAWLPALFLLIILVLLVLSLV